MITLIPVGGLANRMKAIDSAIALAEETRNALKVIWFKDQGLNCSFQELFQPILPQETYISVKEACLTDLLINDRPRKKNLYLPWLFQKLRFDKVLYEQETTRMFYNHFDFAAWCRQQNVYIASCVYFHTSTHKLPFTVFRPTLQLQKKIENVTADFYPNTIGVHIRRTDNIVSIQESPTELFIQRMQEEINRQPDTRFYLATDSEQDKQRLVETFGSHLITSPHKADRNSREGIENALVEMYALSHTRHILGSAKSSYSETAAQLGHITCEIIKRTS